MSAESEIASVLASVCPSWGTTIETQPLGPQTSFTNQATSDIIGPQPASYQPTEPSANATCRWP